MGRKNSSSIDRLRLHWFICAISFIILLFICMFIWRCSSIFLLLFLSLSSSFMSSMTLLIAFDIQCTTAFSCVVIVSYQRNIDDFCYSVFKRWLHFKWVANVDLIWKEKKFKWNCANYCKCSHWIMIKTMHSKLLWKSYRLSFPVCFTSILNRWSQSMASFRCTSFFFHRCSSVFANYCLRPTIKVSINWGYYQGTEQSKIKKEKFN